MGLFTKDIKTMENLFVHTLQDIYYAENQILKSLPKMIEKATKRELSAGLRNYLRETENQVTRLVASVAPISAAHKWDGQAEQMSTDT
jgi:ferritin-like metal-binding protein YciE